MSTKTPIVTNPQIIHHLQNKIGKWAEANFENNTSKSHPDLVLNSLAPLLGLFEELGELEEAKDAYLLQSITTKGCSLAHYNQAKNGNINISPERLKACAETLASIEDALGDIGVYLCDYARREGQLLSLLLPREYTEVDLGCYRDLEIYLGKLSHATLKHHQGIRGFGDYQTYAQHRNAAMSDVLKFLYLESAHWGHNFEVLLTDTFEKVVAKRNWKTHPEDAHAQ